MSFGINSTRFIQLNKCISLAMQWGDLDIVTHSAMKNVYTHRVKRQWHCLLITQYLPTPGSGGFLVSILIASRWQNRQQSHWKVKGWFWVLIDWWHIGVSIISGCFTTLVDLIESLSGKTSYRQISWSLQAASLGVKMIVLFWNLAGISAALLPRCLSRFGDGKSLNPTLAALRLNEILR